jgi:predicted nucleic acid-binding protein
MKLDYLIDTNILILLFNDKLAELIPGGNLGYSIITEIELFSFVGLEKDEETLIRANLESLSQILLSSSIVERTIQLRCQYRLKTPDAIVVASAWECEAILLTNDRKLAQIKEIQTLSLETKNTRSSS